MAAPTAPAAGLLLIRGFAEKSEERKALPGAAAEADPVLPFSQDQETTKSVDSPVALPVDPLRHSARVATAWTEVSTAAPSECSPAKGLHLSGSCSASEGCLSHRSLPEAHSQCLSEQPNLRHRGLSVALGQLASKSRDFLTKMIGRGGTSSPTAGHRRRKVKWVRTVDKHYQIEDSLCELDTPGTSLMRATDADGRHVLVKVSTKFSRGRDHESTFATEEHEAEWREAIETTMNCPGCDGLAEIYEVLEDSKAYYVVMEHVPGMDLEMRLWNSKAPQLPEPEAKKVVRSLLTALRTLHEGGCLHRDVKLENVIVHSNGEEGSAEDLVVKLVDFDEEQAFHPKEMQRQMSKVSWRAMKRTRSSSKSSSDDIVGTNEYISPEAYQGQYSPASDIFSLGVLLFRVIMGRFPFDLNMFDDEPGENFAGHPKMEAIRQRMLSAEIPWDQEPRGGHQPSAEALHLCQQMMAMEPDARPSAREALAHHWFAEGPEHHDDADGRLVRSLSPQDCRVHRHHHHDELASQTSTAVDDHQLHQEDLPGCVH